MHTPPSTIRRTQSLPPIPAGSTTQTAAAKLASPEAPAPKTEAQAAHATTTGGLGALAGTVSKTVLAVTMGAALLFGAAGCALSPVESVDPLPPPVAEAYVQRFAATDAGWVVAGARDLGAVPEALGQILDAAAAARHSDDGSYAFIIGEDGGVFTSSWRSGEVRQIANQLEALAASGTFSEVDARVADAFLHEMVDIFGEVGPTADAGMGLTRAHLSSVESAVLELDSQVVRP